jgi:hypothetical protein
MAFRIGNAGALVAAGIAIYIAVIVAQSQAAASLCDRYSVGARIEDVENLDGTFFLSRMGPAPDLDQPGAQSAIFCASATMCDTSCRLTVKDGLVVESDFSAL